MPGVFAKVGDSMVFIATCDECGATAHHGFHDKWACTEHAGKFFAEFVSQGIAKTVIERIAPPDKEVEAMTAKELKSWADAPDVKQPKGQRKKEVQQSLF